MPRDLHFFVFHLKKKKTKFEKKKKKKNTRLKSLQKSDQIDFVEVSLGRCIEP